METQESTISRPPTPQSPLSSLYRASNTIDDLTLALSSFSRGGSPEPQVNLVCCCGIETCERLQAWHECKTRLESRLTLSAEVGQALLQRHEAYVRRHEVKCRIKPMMDLRQQNILSDDDDDEDDEDTKVFRQEQFDAQFAELLREKETLEKRLNQAIVNNEVTEVANKALLQELQDSRSTISRLTAHHARSIGWDSRLTAAFKERDDMQQERDSESHRARLAESRFAALKDKTIKLQTDVRRLQDALEEKRSHRLESSGSLLQDARTRLESLREAGNIDTMDGHEQITGMLESLVQDNETLKHDNAELQQLLSNTREDFATLQEEYEEYKANPPISRSGCNTPNSRHSHRQSMSSITLTRDFPVFTAARPRSRNLEIPSSDLIPPRSPTDSLSPPKSPPASSRYSPSRYSFEVDTPSDGQDIAWAGTEQRRPHRPLLLLSRSCGVQTEPCNQYPSSHLSTSPMPSLYPPLSPQDRSEASSFSETSSVQMSALIDRIASLLARITQTDPLSLTNRLKRQHLKGADVGHLSKNTINNILSDVNALRQQYRGLLEEDKAALPVTRKDLRGLFKFLRDAFLELAQLRTTLNEVILDPTLAPKISERALHPEREKAGDNDIAANSTPQSWIAPISRLFSPPRHELPPPPISTSTSSRNMRFVPKSGPALAASATTVNVEFSGGGRSTTNAIPGSPIVRSPPAEGTTALKDIFAGAPQLSTSTSTSTDTWVVVPPIPQARRMTSMMQLSEGAVVEVPTNDSSKFPIPDSTRTIGRRTILPVPEAEIPRAVDAIIDESRNQVAPLLQRTLRRRGLSDSSIHSNFVAHGQQDPQAADGSQPLVKNSISGVFKNAWSDGSLVFQALSKTVQNLTLGGSTGSGSEPYLARGAAAQKGYLTESGSSAVGASSAELGSSNGDGSSESTRPQVPRPTPLRRQAQLEPEASSSSPATGATGATSPSDTTESPAPSPSSATSPKPTNSRKAVPVSPRKGKLPDFTSWAAASFMMDPASGSGDPFLTRNVVGSYREHSFLQRLPHHDDEL
ncbi:hypothetical protein NP233_g4661 [Leucocoprinus birnbaumii]|uniref:Uncharacterized protein n=1 Tax=Leucocoprinus birnbaumii TaxID=56174 RepID=A0AAD5VUC0_9AGAR|nr:hypothetical protein NP233_g4661 [Leucocoprinus birnbaumii]